MNGDQNQPGQPGGTPQGWPNSNQGGNSPGNQGQSGGNQNQGDQKPQFAPPPPSQVNIRTTQSDLSSIGRGDAEPVPQSVMPPDDSKEPVFRPETQVGIPSQEAPVDLTGGEEGAPSGGSKRVIIWTSVAILVLAVGAAGYFYVYPLFFGEEEAVVAPPVEPPPPAPPVGTTGHQSLFLAPATASAEVRLTDLLHATILSNLATVALGTEPAGTLEEVSIFDLNGNQVPFSSYLNAFAPSLTVTELQNWFEDDFTSFLYYDANGTWSGMVARVKNGVNIADARVALASLEAADLSRFYLANPGVFSDFRDGQINGKSSRYAPGSTQGSSFNYLMSGNYFIISASYSGLQAVAPLLGL